MDPAQTRVWSGDEVRRELGAILVESLGVEASAVRDDASLIQDLGAESIDFLDISFKAQQLFGVDLPTRLIQDQILEWRSLQVLSSVVSDRYGIGATAEELSGVTPTTLSGFLKYLREKHGPVAGDGAERGLAEALAGRLVSQMSRFGLDMTGVDTGRMANLLLDNVHSPQVMEEVLRRFTVAALSRYVSDRLAAASRLSPPVPSPFSSAPRGERAG